LIPREVHQTRREDARRMRVIGDPPRTAVERSAIDAASWSTSTRTCAGLLAAVVQQRLSTPQRLLETLNSAGRIPQRRLMRLTLTDISGGAEALSEIDFGQLCRRYGLRIALRQEVRRDAQGRRRYIDGVITDPSGARVAFEVDGALHLAVRNYWDDMARGNELVIAGQPVLRFPSMIVRTEPALVADQLRRALSNPASFLRTA
jgi:very-short-patch-repair endonuclease